jgi:DNA modification methylase
MSDYTILQGDSRLGTESPYGAANLLWTDPPFGTGKTRTEAGVSYEDPTSDKAIAVGLHGIRGVGLAPDATVCVCADYRIVHDIIVELKKTLTFQGEIIWTFGLGRSRSTWWPNRHNTIATFTADPDNYKFNPDAIPRTTRLVARSGYPDTKPDGSVWYQTLSNTDPERVGYPNQKPLDIVRPFIRAHTEPGDVVVDPFVGGGTVGQAAIERGRRFVGQDTHESAVELSKKRLSEVVVLDEKDW